MSFLAPLFLLGALTVALPIVFHLIRRTTREVTPFSSLMFLLPTPPRVTRRSRLENLWLLLLRCLAILLLAIGFARPFVQRESAPPPSPVAAAHTVVLLDTSASMRREDLWAQALEKARAAVQRAGPGHVALIAFDHSPRPALSFEEWKRTALEARPGIATQRLEALAPTWAGTALGPALLRAAELLDAPAEAAAARREIVVISDLQEGSQLDGLQGFEWPKGIEVTLDPVRAQRLANASAQWISESDEAPAAAENPKLRLRVTSATESKREQFHLRPEAADAAAIDAYVPAGQSRVIRAPALAGRLLLSGDEVDFDNALHVLPPQPLRVPLLFIGEDSEADPARLLYYLRRAFPKTRQQEVEIVVRGSGASITTYELQQAQLLVLGYGAGEPAIQAARQFAAGGKVVLLPIAQDTSGDAVAQLLGAAPGAVSEAKVKDYAMLAHIDFQHPLFAAFADPRFSDFTKIHVWRHRKLDLAKFPGARVLAGFDSGDPAIVQTPLGAGSVVALATSWQPADSQLALSSKFVPLLHALLELSSRLPPRRAQYFIGDEVPLPRGTQPLTLRKPGGSEVAVPASAASASVDEPGIYTVEPGGQRFVVNLDPDESRLTPLPLERLAGLGVPLKKSSTAAAEADSPAIAARGKAVEIEGRQKLWRWLIAAAFVILLSETFLAGRLARTPSNPSPALSQP